MPERDMEPPPMDPELEAYAWELLVAMNTLPHPRTVVRRLLRTLGLR